MIQTQALNSITREAVHAWLAEHGLDSNDVAEAVIRVDRREPGRISAWLDATWYLRDVDGNRFLDQTGDAAVCTSSIALRSWPPLTPG